MNPLHHIARNGLVEGPFEWTALLELVTTGRLAVSDHVRSVGSEEWLPAWQIPDLFPVVIAPEAGPHAVRVDCLGCFDTVEVSISAGESNAPCPRCGTMIEMDVRDAAADFSGLGGDLTERIAQRVADAYAARSAENGILFGIVKKTGNI